MILKELVYKRLADNADINRLCTRYLDLPAIFDTEAPDDKQDGWGGKSQYPRLHILLDMQANEERSSVGTLSITIYTERTSLVILEIEKAVKECFRDVLISPNDGGPYSFAWARSEPFTIEGQNIIGQEVWFDIMEYPAKETTDPDPIVALSRYIKELYPKSVVLGVDHIEDYSDAAESPIFYCRIVTIDKASGHNMNTIAWMDCRIAIHLLCPDKSKNLKMITALLQNLSVDEKIILLDGSPMSISDVRMDMQADYLKQGQLHITGRFGILKYREKQRLLTANVVTERRTMNDRKETENRNPYRRENSQGAGGRSCLFVR